VLERLESLAADGTGVLLATHDLRDVCGLADRIIAMQNGRVAVDGPPVAALAELEGPRGPRPRR